jgi:hypothetical protein
MPLFHQGHDPSTYLYRRRRAGRDHGARDGQATHLGKLHPAHPGLGPVVDTEAFANVGIVHAHRGGFHEELPLTGRGVRKVMVLQHFRSAEAVVADCLHRDLAGSVNELT